jgi:hypothetical protein
VGFPHKSPIFSTRCANFVRISGGLKEVRAKSQDLIPALKPEQVGWEDSILRVRRPRGQNVEGSRRRLGRYRALAHPTAKTELVHATY